jgi:hypothetical protein
MSDKYLEVVGKARSAFTIPRFPKSEQKGLLHLNAGQILQAKRMKPYSKIVPKSYRKMREIPIPSLSLLY